MQMPTSKLKCAPPLSENSILNKTSTSIFSFRFCIFLMKLPSGRFRGPRFLASTSSIRTWTSAACSWIAQSWKPQLKHWNLAVTTPWMLNASILSCRLVWVVCFSMKNHTRYLSLHGEPLLLKISNADFDIKIIISISKFRFQQR